MVYRESFCSPLELNKAALSYGKSCLSYRCDSSRIWIKQMREEELAFQAPSGVTEWNASVAVPSVQALPHDEEAPQK